MTFEQIVTYIIAPLIAGLAGIAGLVKWVIPKFVEAKLTEQKDVREHRQKMDALQTEYLKAEAETTYQMMGSLLENSQAKEEKANEFTRTTVFNGLDKIKTDTNHIPVLIGEIKAFQTQLNNFETRQRLLIDLITGGLITIEGGASANDYDIWKRNKLNNEPSIPPAKTGGDSEQSL